MDDTYATRDLHFAAFLKVQGMQLIRLEKQQVAHSSKAPVLFIFDNKKECMFLENVFWSGEGAHQDVYVNVKEYVDSIRDLRARTNSVNLG